MSSHSVSSTSSSSASFFSSFSSPSAETGTLGPNLLANDDISTISRTRQEIETPPQALQKLRAEMEARLKTEARSQDILDEEAFRAVLPQIIERLQRHPGYLRSSLQNNLGAHELRPYTDLYAALTSKEGIRFLQSIKKLRCAALNLTVIPTIIASPQFVALQYFDLSNNQLTSLPEHIGSLGTLQTLILRNNRLVALPDLISRLRQLKCLDLTNNALRFLPDSLLKLTSLARFYFEGEDNSSEFLSVALKKFIEEKKVQKPPERLHKKPPDITPPHPLHNCPPEGLLQLLPPGACVFSKKQERDG